MKLKAHTSMKAYTLIEILVVLTIVGVLFTIGYVGYRDFGRRQALAGVAKTIQGDLRKAQQSAMSGIKPTGFACANPQTLVGYFFQVASQTSYTIGASCSGGNINTDSVLITDGITISTPSPNPLLFKILGAGTNIPPGGASIVLTQTATGKTLTVSIGPGGDVK
ncbi:hypothetical protein A2434_00625 [Candidatus Woesebacteria bacterium RIFOXYC1_FULL_41_14]|uniref:Uncharacterized protein n=5 Tax=Candidatus Woeseibacteriota TaxID=1752722 RepID=A0A0G0WUB3_9BACT|nr:MAG: hypothetical protein UU39_C0014G0002 [Candidatus Woesebacteria bacterium GW2011_GWD1_41_12]KKS16340.1 MAG: hypothetical protein UU74_C0044G0006 [Candidatus Woesebacteria bacterium GW2011_GWA1_41_7]OGM81929.1 MAG: hypothetical protein A2393_00815 [Candidatus Woesebacteria bacterium RIFOXYB1_FULL_41_13]OGM84738.1 MAG: hypothetical protein A2434_00625 [Candidatus Woesebacteria bacterium RIFOXYC1_FULL_41_14]OGM88737.1 MAG: hypothetical protein A2594_03220 [Candidatus Woesebacteria bacterium